MELRRLPLTEGEIQELQNVIERKNECSCNIDITFNTIWYRSKTDETELRISFLGNIQATISRVEFTHKRCGTFTEIIEILKRICVEKGIGRIVIQSTLTPEIVKFCKKNGFVPSSYSSYEMDGIILGDYELQL